MVLKTIRNDLRAAYVLVVAWLLAAYSEGQAYLMARADRHPTYARVAQSDTVIAGVVVVIIGSVGIVIVSSVTNAFDSPSNTGLSESQQNLLEGFGAMLDLDVSGRTVYASRRLYRPFAGDWSLSSSSSWRSSSSSL